MRPRPFPTVASAGLATLSGWALWFGSGPEVSEAKVDFSAVQPRLAVRAGPDHGDPLVRVFGDLECPACEAFERDAGRALRAQSAKQGWVYAFHHAPLRGHRLGRLAALADFCARDQQAEWRMWELLTGPGHPWMQGDDTHGHLLEYASRLGLDADRFEACLSSSRPARWLDDNVRLAQAAGVDAIPAVFVNGRRVRPRRSYREVVEAVEAARP